MFGRKKRKEMNMHNHECMHCNGWCWHCKGNGMGSIYGLGFVGALIFYLQQATGFWNGVLGILKAIVWPAFLVFKLLGL